MSHRYGVRANIENEQRRLQREPVAVWKKEWVLPPIAAGAQNNVKVLKWIRTSDTIRFDPEEEHMVGEETMANMEVDPEPAAIETIPVVSSADVLAVESENTSDAALPVTQLGTTDSHATPADTAITNAEQGNDESMDISIDQSINPTEEQAQPAAAANPDTAAIHDSVAIVETSIPDEIVTSTPTQIENKEATSLSASQPVSMTTELESSQPLTQASLPIPSETQDSDRIEDQNVVQSIGNIAETSIVPPSAE